MNEDTIVIAGSARLPENTTIKHVFGYVTIELEVDPADSTIVNVSGTILPSLGEKIISSALVGHKIDEGIETAVAQLEKRFFSVTRKAMIAALEDAHKWYKKFLEKKTGTLQ